VQYKKIDLHYLDLPNVVYVSEVGFDGKGGAFMIAASSLAISGSL